MKLEITRAEASDSAGKMQAAEALAQIRKEWQALAERQSLVAVHASIGLLLLDVADRLGFDDQERLIFLGPELGREIEAFLNIPVDFEIVQ